MVAIGAVVLVMTGTAMAVFAEKGAVITGQREDPINPQGEVIETPLPEDANDTMEDFVSKQPELTEDERQLLIDEEAASQPIYDELQRLDLEIEAITRRVLAGAQDAFDERAALMDTHPELWDKVEKMANEDQMGITDYAEYIRASHNLTESEKETLLGLQARIDELNAIIDSYYQKAEDESADLHRQVEEQLARLHEIQSKTSPIWEKVYGPEQQ